MKTLSIFISSLLLSYNVFAQHQYFRTDSYEAACKVAKEQNKIVISDVYTTWCGPCKWMDANVFSDKEMMEKATKLAVFFKADAEDGGEGSKLARKYAVRAYPTIIFAQPDGSMIEQKIGATPAASFLKLVQQVSDKAHNRIDFSVIERNYKKDKGNFDALKEYVLRRDELSLSNSQVIEDYMKISQQTPTEALLDLILSNDFDVEGQAGTLVSNHVKELHQQKKYAALAKTYQRVQTQLERKISQLAKAAQPRGVAALKQFAANILMQDSTACIDNPALMEVRYLIKADKPDKFMEAGTDYTNKNTQRFNVFNLALADSLVASSFTATTDSAMLAWKPYAAKASNDLFLLAKYVYANSTDKNADAWGLGCASRAVALEKSAPNLGLYGLFLAKIGRLKLAKSFLDGSLRLYELSDPADSSLDSELLTQIYMKRMELGE